MISTDNNAPFESQCELLNRGLLSQCLISLFIDYMDAAFSVNLCKLICNNKQTMLWWIDVEPFYGGLNIPENLSPSTVALVRNVWSYSILYFFTCLETHRAENNNFHVSVSRGN